MENLIFIVNALKMFWFRIFLSGIVAYIIFLIIMGICSPSFRKFIGQIPLSLKDEKKAIVGGIMSGLLIGCFTMITLNAFVKWYQAPLFTPFIDPNNPIQVPWIPSSTPISKPLWDATHPAPWTKATNIPWQEQTPMPIPSDLPSSGG